METPLIDTLEVAEELENLGFPEEQAKGLVRVIARQFNERIVTKEFLREELEKLRRELRTHVTNESLREELDKFVTKEYLREELEKFATKEDIKNFVTEDVLDKKLARTENRLLIWMLSAMGVAVAIISIVTTYTH